MRQPATATARDHAGRRLTDSGWRSPFDAHLRPRPRSNCRSRAKTSRPGGRIDPIKAAASKQRPAACSSLTPIELKVLQGDKVLGSTADGPIIAPAGTHQLDLINAALGFRTRDAVTFRAATDHELNVTIPPGRLSVNAQPWAEVSIDNQPKGETPLANLSVPLGEHEIVFRHPELGERRQTVIVRADQPARASATFDTLDRRLRLPFDVRGGSRGGGSDAAEHRRA